MKFVFVGNRKFVLEAMLKHNLDVMILVIKDSTLERNLAGTDTKFETIASKRELLGSLQRIQFDILVSNGCPYILPVANFDGKKLVNIHPSFLPDLKGVDPVIGAILYERDAGATCHIMNSEIDGGDIISQVKIPYTKDLDVSLLYQLSFLAEKEAFELALKRNFEVSNPQPCLQDAIYYTRKMSDRTITMRESDRTILNKVKAFNNKSQGCYFSSGGRQFRVYSASVVENPYLQRIAGGYDDLQVIFSYEDSIIFKRDKTIFKFSGIENIDQILPKQFLDVL